MSDKIEYVGKNSLQKTVENIRDKIEEHAINYSLDDTGNGLTIDGGFTPQLHSYSTEEKIIGTWIDGKPIYEKVVASTNKPSKLNSIENVYELDINIIPLSLNGMAYIDISSLVGYKSIVKMPLPSYMQSGANTLSVDINSFNKIEMLITNDTWLNYLSNWILIIQYTKTTD